MGSCRVSATANNGGVRCAWLAGGICGKEFATFDTLIGHLRNAHDALEICQWLTDEGSCGKACCEDEFKLHILSHVSCTECRKFFSSENSDAFKFAPLQHGKK